MDKTDHYQNIWYKGIAGLCALFIGIGLSRFAYTPLIPELINKWVSRGGAGYLGTINFAGYLLGAYLAQHAKKDFYIPIIKTSLIVSIIGLALSSINLGFIWLAVWRFVVGVTGAHLMIITPSVILRDVPMEYKGRITGLMFTGIGLGIILSGSFVPFLARLNISLAWLSIAALTFLATLIAWPAFTGHKEISRFTSGPSVEISLAKRQIIMLLMLAYGAYGIGFVPHTLFLVDYVHRELGLHQIISGFFWSIFGIGSLIGPFLIGFAADYIEIYKSLVIAFALGCLAISMVLFNQIVTLYVLSSFLMGALLTGIGTLISSRIVELLGTESHAKFWGRLTLYYAITQAGGAYLMSLLLHQGVPYTGCFIIAEIAFIVGLIAVIYAKNDT